YQRPDRGRRPQHTVRRDRRLRHRCSFRPDRQPGRVHRHPLDYSPGRDRHLPVLADPTAGMRTQVGIVGAGPAGLLLSHLLALRGIDSLVVETRSRAYCEARQRAGVLEDGSVKLLREAGLGERLDAEGLEHGGIYLQFAGERHHVDFRDLTGGRTVTVYAQTEVVKDLIARRHADGGRIEFEVAETGVAGLDSDRPVLSYTARDGGRHEVECDVIAGCDGFHGICRPAFPAGTLTVTEREYPFAWLGILAEVPPSTDELIYAHHQDGF